MIRIDLLLMLKTPGRKWLLFGHIYDASHRIISHVMLGECNYLDPPKGELAGIKCAQHLMRARLCLLLQIYTR